MSTNYLNLMGITGSGKTTFFNNYNNRDKLNFRSKLMEIYYKKTPNEIKLISQIFTPSIYLNSNKIIKKHLNNRLNKLNKIDKIKYKLSFTRKLQFNYLIKKIQPNFFIEDEGILSFIDNFYIHPQFIEMNFEFEKIIDNFFIIPNKIIYFHNNSELLRKRYIERDDKPWRFSNKKDLIEFFEKSKKKYDIFLNVMSKKYNTKIIYHNNV